MKVFLLFYTETFFRISRRLSLTQISLREKLPMRLKGLFGVLQVFRSGRAFLRGPISPSPDRRHRLFHTIRASIVPAVTQPMANIAKGFISSSPKII